MRLETVLKASAMLSCEVTSRVRVVSLPFWELNAGSSVRV